MVRIKHRYLLFNILYPAEPSPPKPTPTPTSTLTSSSHTSQAIPTFINIHRPSPSHLTSQLLLSTLRHTIAHNFGDHGLAVTQSGLRIVYFSPATSTCILRCPRAQFRTVWASLTFLHSFPGLQRGDAEVACVVQVVRVSGTIRKSEEELTRRARRDIVRAKMEGITTAEGLDVDANLFRGITAGPAGGKKPDPSAFMSNLAGDDGIEDLPIDEEELDDDMSDMDE